VYKGTISGTAVAVKRFVRDVEHVEREFLAEASSTSQIRHRNLVHLQGWCREDGHFLLVFEYISNGSLDEWLFPGRRRYPRDPKFSRFQVLPLELRVSILAGIAAAVEYLHEEWIKVVLHRDIKSSNVMLDEEFSAYLVDFGLSRVIDHAKRDKTTVMAGTLGYMAPEIHFTGKATKQSDVYSFGVLVLEVVSGRRPINLLVEDPDENHLLVQTVWQAREAGNILRAVLPPLLDVYNNSQDLNPVPDEESNSLPTSSINGLISEIVPEVNGSSLRFERKLVRLLHLGLHCCLPSPEARPSIRVVKQAIMLVMQGEDTVTSALDSVPPLPSTMPVGFASVPPIVPSVEETILAHLDDRDSLASFAPRSDTMSVLRRRFPSTENKSQVD
jgi:serine/threonine protein kinase